MSTMDLDRLEVMRRVADIRGGGPCRVGVRSAGGCAPATVLKVTCHRRSRYTQGVSGSAVQARKGDALRVRRKDLQRRVRRACARSGMLALQGGSNFRSRSKREIA